LVDSESTDRTNELVDEYKLDTTQCIPFTYGKALNQGMEKTNSEYVAILSPHCFPTNKDYLKNMWDNFSSVVAGVYARQIPHKYTNPIEYRNFIHTYGNEKIIQRECPLFNNGASMISRKIWEKIPFDENLPALEDIYWAKQCIDNKYCIVYEPKSIVEHLHDDSYADAIRRYERECLALKQMEFLKW
jgi:glycosyltransferase involved in cell wall biosynthesis